MRVLLLLLVAVTAAPDRLVAQESDALRRLAQAEPGDWVSALAVESVGPEAGHAAPEPRSIRPGRPAEAPSTPAGRPTEPLPAAPTLERSADAASDPPPATQAAPPVVQDELRPAEVVAARVRRVLGDAGDRDAWRDLAGALPELALSGDADPESTFTATRFAEEALLEPLAPAVPAEPGAAVPASRSPAPPPVSWNEPRDAAREPVAVDSRASVRPAPSGGTTVLETVNVELLGTLFALLAAGAVVWSTVRTQAPRVRPVSPPRAGTRLEQVRALAASGASEADIARRTGIPRDAVAVLMRVSVR